MWQDSRRTGTLAAVNDAVTVNHPGIAVATAQLTGTFVGTVVFEVNEDEGASPTWVPVNANNVNTNASVASATAPGIFKIDASGHRLVRVRCSVYTSGSIAVTLNASHAPASPGLQSGGSAVSVADGSDAAEGATTDVAVNGDNPGTISAKLRGLNKLFSDVWDSVNHWLQVKVMAALPTGANVIGGVTQSGTWTVQPGNTANTTAWKVDGSAVTQPVSGTVTSTQGTQGAAGTASWNVQGADATGATITGKPVLAGINDGGGLVRITAGINQANNSTGNGIQAISPTLWDGTNFQKAAQVTQATGTTGTGVPAAAPVLWDAVGTTNFVKQAGDGSGRTMVVGAAAAGAAIAGNPVQVGGTDGTNAQPLKVDTAGRPMMVGAAASAAAAAGNPVWVGMWDGATNIVAPVCGTPSDGLGSSTGTQRAMAFAYGFNGATYDRLRVNADVTLLASAARTTLQNSANITVYNCRAIIVTVDVTATVSTVSLTPSINYVDPASGKLIPLLTATAIAAAGTFTYWVNMNAIVGTPAPFTKTVQADIGRVIAINMAVGNANSQTYSIGYTLIPA